MVLHADEGGDQRLVAYVVAQQGVVLTTENCARSCGGCCRSTWCRRGFVRLESLPLTPNGKLDRKRLPAGGGAAGAGTAYVAPRNGGGGATVWHLAEVLGLERVGVHDNFFDLGGHSLLATQVISRVREHLQVELPLLRCSTGPTVARVGRACSGNGSGRGGRGLRRWCRGAPGGGAAVVCAAAVVVFGATASRGARRTTCPAAVR